MSWYRNSWLMARIGNQDGGRGKRSNSGAGAMQPSVAWSGDLVCLVFCVIPSAGVELGRCTTHPKLKRKDGVPVKATDRAEG